MALPLVNLGRQCCHLSLAGTRRLRVAVRSAAACVWSQATATGHLADFVALLAERSFSGLCNFRRVWLTTLLNGASGSPGSEHIKCLRPAQASRTTSRQQQATTPDEAQAAFVLGHVSVAGSPKWRKARSVDQCIQPRKRCGSQASDSAAAVLQVVRVEQWLGCNAPHSPRCLDRQTVAGHRHASRF